MLNGPTLKVWGLYSDLVCKVGSIRFRWSLWFGIQMWLQGYTLKVLTETERQMCVCQCRLPLSVHMALQSWKTHCSMDSECSSLLLFSFSWVFSHFGITEFSHKDLKEKMGLREEEQPELSVYHVWWISVTTSWDFNLYKITDTTLSGTLLLAFLHCMYIMCKLVCSKIYGVQVWQQGLKPLSSPDSPPTSIFFRFLASKITTVNFPAVGTYLSDRQTSPSFSL